MRHQPDTVQHLETADFGFVGAATKHLDLRNREIFGHGQVRKQLKVLEHHAHAGTQLGQVCRRVMQGHAIHLNAAFLDWLQRIDGLDQGGLARPGRTTHHYHVTFVDLERAVAQHLHRAIPLGHIFHFNHIALRCLANDRDLGLQSLDKPGQGKTNHEIDHGGQ